jgi:hypothetical protein
MLTGIFGLKEEKGTVEWRKPQHEEYHDAVSSTRVIDCRVK